MPAPDDRAMIDDDDDPTHDVDRVDLPRSIMAQQDLEVKRQELEAKRLSWDRRTPLADTTVELKMLAKNYCYFQGYTLQDVKELRPCKGDKGMNKETQKQLKSRLDKFYAQPHRREGDCIIVTETYSTSAASRFPGSLYSSKGSQGVYRPIRSHLLSRTEDLDMVCAMPTILVWVIENPDPPCDAIEWCPKLKHYIKNRDAVLAQFMTDVGCTREYAKQQFYVAWTLDKQMKGACTKNDFFVAYDAEAKRLQKKLMKRPELQWILEFCKKEGDNRAGSFIAHVYQFVVSRLLDHVMKPHREIIQCIAFDGINILGTALHGDEELRRSCSSAKATDWKWRALVLRQLGRRYLSARCEEVCPGINMQWAWKALDFNVRTADSKTFVKTLTIPEDFEPPPAPGDGEGGGGGGGGGGGDGGLALDPHTEPTYLQLRRKFSLPTGKHGKVGCDFIEVIEEDGSNGRGKGKLVTYGKEKFVIKYEHMMYYSLEKKNNVMVKVEHSFIQRWLKDPKMDEQYLKDPSQRCCWDYFDMHPTASDCPAHCFNLWQGFAGARYAVGLDLENLDGKVKEGLDRVLGHISMLCARDGPAHEKFLLDTLAHVVQYPNVKFGVMCCLVGKQGIGKTQLWEAIARIIGKHGCFETGEPQRDVFGDNNDNMRTAFMVRLMETDKKAFAGQIGKVRAIITDDTIRVRSLYGSAANVKSYARFFCDTNERDAIPDSDNERRFFILDCNDEKIPDDVYFKELADAIEDDQVIGAFYLWLMKRQGVKQRYSKSDIPVGAYARELKGAKRSLQEKFIIHLVEGQSRNQTVARFTDDELYEKYNAWQEAGKELERSKQSFASWLRLKKFDIPGIHKHRPLRDLPGQPSHVDAQPVPKQQVFVTEYVFELSVLREHYRLIADVEPPPPPAVIEIERRPSPRHEEAPSPPAPLQSAIQKPKPAGKPAGKPKPKPKPKAQPPVLVSDDDDDDILSGDDDDELELEELGRRMHKRGEQPSPTPCSANDRVRSGYNAAAAEAMTGLTDSDGSLLTDAEDDEAPAERPPAKKARRA